MEITFPIHLSLFTVNQEEGIPEINRRMQLLFHVLRDCRLIVVYLHVYTIYFI